MNKPRSIFALSISALLLTAGFSPAYAEETETEKLFDFDEEVHYYQTKLSDGRYHLEIQSDDYKHFRNQSVFLLRHASRLCIIWLVTGSLRRNSSFFSTSSAGKRRRSI